MQITVVTGKHPLIYAPQTKQTEDTFDTRRRQLILDFVLVLIGVLRQHCVEKACRRQLLAVSDHHDLPASYYRAQRISRLHLAGFIKNYEIEIECTGWNEIGN